MPGSFPLEETTIRDVQAAFLSGTLTARALVQAYLNRIAAIDRAGPRLNSILAINAEALATAGALDARLAAGGKLVGPLHGIPVVLKDQIETAGLVTTFGSKAASSNVPERDARIVTALTAAGAIVLAKTTMPDFAASWHSTSSVSGTTRNPYALDHDAGGSSSGTAAAVAANLATAGIGEDTGGSIRLPASFCNLVGLRVTPGLISRAGLSPLSLSQDTPGPMTRTVTDAAILLDVLVAFDPDDPYTAAAAIGGRPGSYLQALDGAELPGMRIGVLRRVQGSDDDPDSAAVNQVFAAALRGLTAAGAELVDVTVRKLRHYVVGTSVLFSSARADLDAFLRSRPGIAADSVAALCAGGLVHAGLDMITRIAAGPESPAGDPGYYRRLAAAGEFQRLVVGLMTRRRLHALCFPDVRIPAPSLADVHAARWTSAQFPTNTVIASQLGMPAISVPAGFSADGRPVGMELMTLPYHEADLLGLAFAVEQATAARTAPALGRP